MISHERAAIAGISGLVDTIETFQKSMNGESLYWIRKMIEQREQLFDRFCPFKDGDRVRLAKTPDINEKESWGWLGAKHFLVEGALGTVHEPSFRKGLFFFYVTFDDDSWKDSFTGEIHTRTPDQRSHYCFSERWLEAATPTESGGR